MSERSEPGGPSGLLARDGTQTCGNCKVCTSSDVDRRMARRGKRGLAWDRVGCDGRIREDGSEGESGAFPEAGELERRPDREPQDWFSEDGGRWAFPGSWKIWGESASSSSSFFFYIVIFIFSIIAGLQCSVNVLPYSRVTQ